MSDANKNRRSIIWVGANDGMLHAIDARLGKEVWAFIPLNLLPKLETLRSGQPLGDFRFFVDGSPKVADVKIAGKWRTYLVMGEGPGGTFYQTFDVTLDDLALTAAPDDDNIAPRGQLHGSFCSGQACTRDLTLDEARIQVASGIAYVRICRTRARTQLAQAGVEWDETGSDFWSLVKMQHNLPSIPKVYIPKLRPSSWDEFKEGVLNEQPKYGTSTIFSNAEDIGAAAG